jgi:hypothetical protein
MNSDDITPSTRRPPGRDLVVDSVGHPESYRQIRPSVRQSHNAKGGMDEELTRSRDRSKPPDCH